MLLCESLKNAAGSAANWNGQIAICPFHVSRPGRCPQGIPDTPRWYRTKSWGRGPTRAPLGDRACFGAKLVKLVKLVNTSLAGKLGFYRFLRVRTRLETPHCGTGRIPGVGDPPGPSGGPCLFWGQAGEAGIPAWRGNSNFTDVLPVSPRVDASSTVLAVRTPDQR